MSLKKVINFIETKLENNQTTVSEVYGTEHFCYFLYSLVRMTHPLTVVELGTGTGMTTCMIAQALKENQKGQLWTIDDGSDWKNIQPLAHYFLKEKFKGSYPDFLSQIFRGLELEHFISFQSLHLSPDQFFNPHKPIDLLFEDAQDAGPQGCINLLRYYLPKMNTYSSIFIDRASTIHHSYLMLEEIIKYLQQGKIPQQLIRNMNKEEVYKVEELVKTSKFTLIHLTETAQGKHSKHQNSRAWIKIEPIDVVHHNQVYTFSLNYKET